MKLDKIKLPRPKTYVKKFYCPDGTLRYKSRYIKATNELVKDVFFYQDGETISQIVNYNKGEFLKAVYFNADGEYMGYLSKNEMDLLSQK